VRLAEFDYDLPPELIAQEPVEPRDASRLLVVHRESGRFEHVIFRDLPGYLKSGDCLVLNQTRVIPARLIGRRVPTGGAAELLLLRRLDRDRWEALVRPGRRLKPGARISFAGGRLEAVVEGRVAEGARLVRFEYQGIFEEILDHLGRVPLPPYITRELADDERYQTVYATVRGASAAPTAGLHFTPELLEGCRRMGVGTAYLTLHIGLGTFRPIREEVIEEHQMHEEYFELGAEAADLVNATRRNGGRVVAVGTTAVRTLETVAAEDGLVRPAAGMTDKYIYPGYRFRAVDAMVTNFHLPKSSLILLVSAFAGRDLIMRAYADAVTRRYRFFSFGDAMLIL
jgi:S-adenosylmethionine:tRNA ribosyltransferase-isomerase